MWKLRTVLKGSEGYIVGVIVPVGYGQAAFIFSATVGTPEFVTTIGVDLDGVGGNFIGAADHLFDAYNDAFMGTTSSMLSLDRVNLTIGVDGGGNGSVSSTRPSEVGGDVGNWLPINVGVILRKQTYMLGRAGRGRMFLPGVLNNSQVSEGGVVSQSAIDGLTQFGNKFLDSIKALDAPDAPEATMTPMEPVLLHSGEMVPTPISSMGVAPLIGVQRKRVR